MLTADWGDGATGADARARCSQCLGSVSAVLPIDLLCSAAWLNARAAAAAGGGANEAAFNRRDVQELH